MKHTGAVVLVGLALASLAFAGAAEPIPFSLSGHQQLRVRDQLVRDAKLYLNVAGAPRLLVTAPTLARSVLIVAGAKNASLVEQSQIAASPDDPEVLVVTADLSAPGTLPLVVDGTRLRVTLGETLLIVEPREPLVGEIEPADLLAYMPEYRRLAAAYRPGRGDLSLLGTLAEETDVDVFFGTWCPHCEKAVPKLIRVVQELGNPKLKVHFRGLPTQIEEDPMARQYKVTAVPTAVIRRGTTQMARLEGQNWNRPESALAALLFGGETAGAAAPGPQ